MPVFTASSSKIQYSASTSFCPSENNQGSPHSGQQSQLVLSVDNRITRLKSPGQNLSSSAFSSCIFTPPPHSGVHAPQPIKREGSDSSHLRWLPNKPKPLDNSFTLTGAP